LAPRLVEQIFDILERIRAEGTTVLVVEQNAAMALELADRAYVLETGVVTQSGKARELAEDANVRRAYLGAA
jgi:branched-chain amino acid transport system ATP-binding protein